MTTEKTNAAAAGNRMGTEPVRPLLLRMGGPMMLSMLGQALYNVVDTYFVSHIKDTAAVTAYGEKAVNALMLAYPIQILMIALGVGTGVGINSALARTLGQKNRRLASKTAGNAILLGVLYFLVIFLFGLTGAGAFIKSQTGNAQIAAMGTQYLRIVTIFSFGTMMYMTFEKIVMATGKTVITMAAQLAGALTNIVLDPIMIYGLLGLTAMRVEGAALATVIGQFVSLIIIVIFYYRTDRDMDHAVTYVRPDRAALRNIYAVGFPAIVMQILVPIMSYGMNRILGAISTSAVTAYGIYYKLQNFIFMPAYGLNNASIPIIAFNRGAGKSVRVRETIRCGLIDVTVIMALGILLLGFGARPIVGIFGLTKESGSLTVTALRIVCAGFLFAGINIILQGACQAMEKGGYSLVISLFRLILITLPAAFLLSRTGSSTFLVWFSIPAGELTASLVAIPLT